jgi:uncharacterized RDD family membrane protein YckC
VFAGFWIRAAALLIDGILVSILELPVLIHTTRPILRAFQEASRTGAPYQPTARPGFAWILAGALVSYVYEVVMIGKWNATVGKFATRIRVRKVDGSPATWREAAIRPLLQLAVGLPRIVGLSWVTLLDDLWMLWDKRNQTLHDKIAGTIVVKT